MKTRTSLSLPKELIAVPEEVGMSSAILENLDSVMADILERKVLKGAVILAARHGKIVWYKPYGLADEGVAMRMDHIFRLASMTKAVTAVAAMQLSDQGKLLVSDPIAKYIPGFANIKVAEFDEAGNPVLVDPKRPPTVQDLMTMTAGFGSTWAGGHKGMEYYKEQLAAKNFNDCMFNFDFDIEAFCEPLFDVALGSHPGEHWEYSNISTNILGRVVEVVSGVDFNTYIQENIFEPLGIVDADFYPDESKHHRIPQIYEAFTGERLLGLDQPGMHDTQVPFKSPKKFFNPCGGLCCTAYDYFRFAQMLANKGELDGVRVLSPHSVEMMTQNHVGDMRDSFYGHAWGYNMNVQCEYNNTFNYLGNGAFGWHGYWGTVFNVLPEKDLVMVFLSQCSPEVPSWEPQEKVISVISSAAL